MKKLMMLFCCMFVLCLAACSEPSVLAPSSLPSASSRSTESVSSSGPASLDTAIPDSAKSVFDITKDELISYLQDYLEYMQDKDPTSVSVLPSDITPTVKEAGETDTALAGSYYTYQIHDDVTLTIVDSAQSGKVQSVSLATSTSVFLSGIQEGPSLDFGMYMGYLMFIFEPDQDERSRLQSEFLPSLASLPEGHFYSTAGSLANYQYSISDGNAVFVITPLDESDATATPPSSSMEETVFNTTVDEVISVLDSGVKDYAHILPSSITPTTLEWEAVGNTVAGTYYSYLIYSGVTLTIVDSAQSGKVQSVSLIADISKLTEESSWDFACYKSILVAMFEPDNERWSSIDTDLNINADFSEDNIYLSSGTVAKYVYTIAGGLATLSIDPK